MQNIILLLFTIFFATGSYFLLAELCKVPSYRASKVILNAGRKRKKQVKDSDAFILELAEKLAKILPMEEYKRRKIADVLKSAEISMTPEVYVAQAYVKAGLVLEKSVSSPGEPFHIIFLVCIVKRMQIGIYDLRRKKYHKDIQHSVLIHSNVPPFLPWCRTGCVLPSVCPH